MPASRLSLDYMPTVFVHDGYRVSFFSYELLWSLTLLPRSSLPDPAGL
jgi:hypothetical protein